MGLKVKNWDHLGLLSAKAGALDGLDDLCLGFAIVVYGPSRTPAFDPFMQFVSGMAFVSRKPLDNPYVRGTDFCQGRWGWQSFDESPFSISKFVLRQCCFPAATVTPNV